MTEHQITEQQKRERIELAICEIYKLLIILDDKFSLPLWNLKHVIDEIKADNEKIPE